MQTSEDNHPAQQPVSEPRKRYFRKTPRRKFTRTKRIPGVRRTRRV
jgi:hypothetical protein